ncbi:hypothetical protein NKG05_04380 [Oerskovia sp. M15]
MHLLPTFDIASIEEDRAKQSITGDLSGFAPDGTEQQAAVTAIQGTDAFNWGYDPLHFSTPEGSYAVDAEGPLASRSSAPWWVRCTRPGSRSCSTRCSTTPRPAVRTPRASWTRSCPATTTGRTRRRVRSRPAPAARTSRPSTP